VQDILTVAVLLFALAYPTTTSTNTTTIPTTMDPVDGSGGTPTNCQQGRKC